MRHTNPLRPPLPQMIALLAMLAAPLLAGANAAEYRASSYVFGTVAEIIAIDADAERARDAVELTFREFDRMHRDLHAWKPGALVALNQAIASGRRSIRTTPEIAMLIRAAQRLAEQSGNLFNPAIGRLVGLWNFHRDHPAGPVPGAQDIARVLAGAPRMSDLRVQGNTVMSLNPWVQLDFGGYAKGYALDRAVGLLREHGITNALINVGGNIIVLGSRVGRPWRVGIESPRRSALMATIELFDGEAIGTSGDYRRYYEVSGKRYAHIIDPRTGYPVPKVRSVTVLAPPQAAAGALADAASKPIFIEGLAGWRDAAKHIGISCAMLIDSEGAVHITRALESRLHFADRDLVIDPVD